MRKFPAVHSWGTKQNLRRIFTMRVFSDSVAIAFGWSSKLLNLFTLRCLVCVDGASTRARNDLMAPGIP